MQDEMMEGEERGWRPSIWHLGIVLLIAGASWMMFRERPTLSSLRASFPVLESTRVLESFPVLESSPAVERWDGVWMNGPALLRLRQTGASLTGEYGPNAAFLPLYGAVEGDTATFHASGPGMKLRKKFAGSCYPGSRNTVG